MKLNNAYKTLGTDLRIVKANKQIDAHRSIHLPLVSAFNCPLHKYSLVSFVSTAFGCYFVSVLLKFCELALVLTFQRA